MIGYLRVSLGHGWVNPHQIYGGTTGTPITILSGRDTYGSVCLHQSARVPRLSLHQWILSTCWITTALPGVAAHLCQRKWGNFGLSFLSLSICKTQQRLVCHFNSHIGYLTGVQNTFSISNGCKISHVLLLLRPPCPPFVMEYNSAHRETSYASGNVIRIGKRQ